LLSLRHLAAPPPAKRASASRAVGALYEKHCAKCHGVDGKGAAGRAPFPETPDFTLSSWQRGPSDAQLLTSILEGKGTGMPAARDKITKSQAGDLVACVRSFASTAKKGQQDKAKMAAGADLDDRYRRLQKEFDDLKRQFDELSKGSQHKGTGEPTPSQRPGPATPAESATPPSKPITPAAAEVPAEGELFRRRCVKCHGTDGSGSRVHHRQPEIPDFSDPAWQARRSDAQLLASILDGKGKRMPSWRDKIRAELARGLVAVVRGFVSTPKQPVQEKREKAGPPYATEEKAQEPAPSDVEQTQTAHGFFQKLIGWLGNFHPATVHFPVALLTAAAVAELLRLVTRRPAFDAITRYCLWFGALTAVAAAVLGWFLGGFRVMDASWLLTAHRWLGTSTTFTAVLLLALSEGSRAPERWRTRICFRSVLLILTGLVLATGFFGGAAVYGLDHYSWSP
jgi:mono/diheme cytochrome c family protein/uncharacterized membrane protein